jgi:hypothetical protein
VWRWWHPPQEIVDIKQTPPSYPLSPPGTAAAATPMTTPACSPANSTGSVDEEMAALSLEHYQPQQLQPGFMNMVNVQQLHSLDSIQQEDPVLLQQLVQRAFGQEPADNNDTAAAATHMLRRPQLRRVRSSPPTVGGRAV